MLFCRPLPIVTHPPRVLCIMYMSLQGFAHVIDRTEHSIHDLSAHQDWPFLEASLHQGIFIIYVVVHSAHRCDQSIPCVKSSHARYARLLPKRSFITDEVPL